MIPAVLSRSLILMTTVWSVIGSFPVTHAVTDSFPTSHTNTDHTDCIEVLDARCSKVFCNLLCGYNSTHRVAITDCFTKSDNVRLHIWEQAKQHTLHTLVHGVWCVDWVQLLATHTHNTPSSLSWPLVLSCDHLMNIHCVTGSLSVQHEAHTCQRWLAYNGVCPYLASDSPRSGCLHAHIQTVPHQRYTVRQPDEHACRSARDQHTMWEVMSTISTYLYTALRYPGGSTTWPALDGMDSQRNAAILWIQSKSTFNSIRGGEDERVTFFPSAVHLVTMSFTSSEYCCPAVAGSWYLPWYVSGRDAYRGGEESIADSSGCGNTTHSDTIHSLISATIETHTTHTHNVHVASKLIFRLATKTVSAQTS